MTEIKQNLQDVFLNHLRKHKTPTTVFSCQRRQATRPRDWLR